MIGPSRVRAIFCGTPEIAVPSLRALAELAEIVGVVCQPDRPSGRGMKLRPPAVKLCAAELGLDVFQPTRVRDGALADWIRQREPDFALVIAYGRILPSATLAAPRLGCLNLHASLLPELRGAAPIQRALMQGKTETGVCLMQMDEGMDTGDVLSCRKSPILEDDDAGSLADRLGKLAATITKEDIPRFFRGQLSPVPQNESEATYAAPLSKEEARLAFDSAAFELQNRIRGLTPSPGAFCLIETGESRGRRLKVLKSRVWPANEHLPPGQIKWAGAHLLVGTRDTPLEIVLAQPEGKRPQAGHDLKNGRVLADGDQLC